MELKAEGVEEAVLEVLGRARVLERTFLSSFDAGTMRRLARLAPDVRRFLLADAWNEGMREEAAGAAVHGICLRVDAAGPRALDILRGEGYAVIVWTVDDPALARELLHSGIAAVITNRPSIGNRGQETGNKS